MELNDYLRYSEGMWRTFDKEAGSDAPTDLEREFVLFKLGTLYLFEREVYLYPTAYPNLGPHGEMHAVANAKAIEGSQVYARKLRGLPALHNFSRLFIARVDEMDGIPLPRWVAYPKDAQHWSFQLFSREDGGTEIDNVRAEYLNDRIGGSGTVFAKKVWGAVCLLCLKGAESDEQRTIKELRDGFITLRVFKEDR